MLSNIHPIERVVRILIGLFLFSLTFWGPQSNWFLLGAVPAITGALGWCPIFHIMGIDTTKIDRQT